MASMTVTEVEQASASFMATDSTKVAPQKVMQKQIVLSDAAQSLLDNESQYTVGGFTPLPGFFERGKGSQLWVDSPFTYIEKSR